MRFAASEKKYMTSEHYGGTRKFLYSVPDSFKIAKPDNVQHSPASSSGTASHGSNSLRGLPVDLDSAWSIRNVGLTPSIRSVTPEHNSIKGEILSKTAGMAFYSRHAGLKGRAESPLNGQVNPGSAGARGKWTSSGHNFPQGVQLKSQSPTFPARPNRGLQNSRQRLQNSLPFNNDI